MDTARPRADIAPPARGQAHQSSAQPYGRRSFLKFGGSAAAGAALAACAPRALTTARTPAAVQLVYQDWRTDWFPALAQAALALFHQRNPGIQVFYTPDPENLEEQMQADFQSGTAPDILAGCCDFMAQWGQEGFLLDLRPFVAADLEQSTIDDWDPAQYRSFFTLTGVQFALPKYHGALGLFYNKDLFDRYGVDYPQRTWGHEDYLAAMKQLTRDRDGDGQTDLWGSMFDVAWERIQVHVNGWGGHFVDPNDPTKSWMSRPESMAAMTWLKQRMWDDRVMASFVDVQNLETRQAFIGEHVAMVEDGSWALKDILEGAPFRVGVTSFPAGPSRKVTLATSDGFGIYAGTRHPEAAWELLKFLTSRDYGRAMARAHFLQPARRSLVEEWTGYIQDQYPRASAGLDLAAFAEGHEQNYSVTAEVFSNMAEARQLTQAAWQQIFTLGQAPVELMVSVSAQIELSQQRGS